MRLTCSSLLPTRLVPLWFGFALAVSEAWAHSFLSFFFNKKTSFEVEIVTHSFLENEFFIDGMNDKILSRVPLTRRIDHRILPRCWKQRILIILLKIAMISTTVNNSHTIDSGSVVCFHDPSSPGQDVEIFDKNMPIQSTESL